MLGDSVLIFAVICLFLTIHPYTTYPLSLLIAKQWHKRHQMPEESDQEDLSVDIVFCAHNEEATIRAKMKNLVELMDAHEDLEVRVYLDGCTDKTAEIINLFVRPQLHIVDGKDRAGKSRGMNILLQTSSADVVIFTDANVILDKEIVNVAKEAFRSKNLGCLCGNLIYTNAEESQTAGLGALYWRIEEEIKNLECQSGSAMGADGSLFALRRTLFREVPEDIIDDFYSSMGSLFQGYEIKRHGSFKAFERSTTESLDEFRRKVRIACRSFNCHRHMRSNLRKMSLFNRYKYISHKVLRWMGIYLALTALIAIWVWTVLNGLGMTYLVLTISIAGVMTMATKLKIRGLSAISEVVLMYVAAGVGVFHSLQGKRYQTWSSASSSR